MKTLQGTMAHVAGDPQTRDTTRGSNEALFPSMREDEVKEILHPIFCNLCGLQIGFVATPGVKGYCRQICKDLDELLEREMNK